MVSALAAKNLGIKDRKKKIPQKITGKTPQNRAGKDPNMSDAEVIVDDSNCKNCGSELSAPCDQHERVVVDITFRSIATKYTVVRRYCKTCKKQVSAPVPDTLPNEPSTMPHTLSAFHKRYSKHYEYSRVCTVWKNTSAY